MHTILGVHYFNATVGGGYAANVGVSTNIGGRDAMEDFVFVRHVFENRDASHVVEALELMCDALGETLEASRGETTYTLRGESAYVEEAFRRFGFFTTDEVAGIQERYAEVRKTASAREAINAAVAGVCTQLVGVFDGHSGEECARRASEELPALIIYSPAWERGDYATALVKGCELFGRRVEKLTSGCTACVVAVTASDVYCANVGDSRAIACVAGVALPLSVDHKPETEVARIRAAGGHVIYDVANTARLMGCLSLSRAFGDSAYSDCGMIRTPDVRRIPRTGAQFVVVATDGIWERMSNEEVVEYYRELAATRGAKIPKITRAFADNTSEIVVFL